MAHFHTFNFGVNIIPPPPPGTAVAHHISQMPLQLLGLNFLLEVSTATAFVASKNPVPRRAIPVMAHLDTGASSTAIDESLATHLGLISVGKGRNATANGFRESNFYVVDAAFINTPLKGIQNLQISSIHIPSFNLNAAIQNPMVHQNFGVLIGRDILSRWQVTWHGPSSTVFVSD